MSKHGFSATDKERYIVANLYNRSTRKTKMRKFMKFRDMLF